MTLALPPSVSPPRPRFDAPIMTPQLKRVVADEKLRDKEATRSKQEIHRQGYTYPSRDRHVQTCARIDANK